MKKICSAFFLAFWALPALAAEKIAFLHGEMTVNKNSYRAEYELQGEGGEFLAIRPAGSKNICRFSVSRLEPPHEERGRSGVIFANREKSCRFEMAKAEEKRFWDSIILLDVGFRLDPKGQIVGGATLSSARDIFKAGLSHKK